MAERAASRAFLKTEMAESQEATAAAIKAEAIAERAERVASQANFDHQAIANKTKSGLPDGRRQEAPGRDGGGKAYEGGGGKKTTIRC